MKSFLPIFVLLVLSLTACKKEIQPASIDGYDAKATQSGIILIPVRPIIPVVPTVPITPGDPCKKNPFQPGDPCKVTIVR